MADGYQRVSWSRLNLFGPGRVGKTSLKNSLQNKPNSRWQGSTEGIHLSRATCSIVEKDGKWVLQEEKDRERYNALVITQAVLRKTESCSTSNSASQTPASSTPSSPGPSPNASTENLTTEEDRQQTHQAPPSPGTHHLAKFVTSLSANWIKLRSRILCEHFHAIDIWDFGGQRAYAILQHLVLANSRCQYLVVFDASAPLDAPARPETFGLHGVEFDVFNPSGMMTNMDVLVYWLDVVFQTVKDNGRVIIVGTKIDRIWFWQSYCLLAAEEAIFKRLKAKPYYNMLEKCVYFVDNFRSGSFIWSRDRSVVDLLGKVMEAVKKDPAMQVQVPLKWLPFTNLLQQHTENLPPVMKLNDITHKAQELCGIRSDKEAQRMVDFHHSLGLLLHFTSTAALRDNVVIDVEWLLTVTSALLHPLSTSDKEFKDHFRFLHTHGILLESLAVHIWSVRCSQPSKLMTDKQRHFLFSLMEHLCVFFPTGMKMSPGKAIPHSRMWFCPSLVQHCNDSLSADTTQFWPHVIAAHQPSTKPPEQSINGSASDEITTSSSFYLLSGDERQFHQTQFWRLIVLCMFHLRLLRNAGTNSPILSPDDCRLPRLSYSSAKVPCDSLYPGYHICLSHFREGVKLCIVQEHKAIALLREQGEQVKLLADVCSSLAKFVEESLHKLNGRGIAAPKWLRAARCLCQGLQHICRLHSNPDCQSMSCSHFIQLDMPVPFCPLTGAAANPEAVIKDWLIKKRRAGRSAEPGDKPTVPADSFDAKSGRGDTGGRNVHMGQASNSPKGPPSSTLSQAAIDETCSSLLPGKHFFSMKGQTSMIPSTSVSQGERDSSSDSDELEFFDCKEPTHQRDIVYPPFLDQQANDLQLDYIATHIPITWQAVALHLGFMKHETD